MKKKYPTCTDCMKDKEYPCKLDGSYRCWDCPLHAIDPKKEEKK